MAELLGLLQRIGSAIHISEAIDERAREPEERIRPVRSKCRGFSECHDRVSEIALRALCSPSRLVGFTVDTEQMPIAIAQRCTKRWVEGRHSHGARQRFTRRLPLVL